MTLYSKSPYFVIKAVFSLSSSATSTCQYPEAKSIEVNHFDHPSLSIISLINGRGYRSFLVTLFNFLYSTQNLHFPFFFLTNVTGDAHGLVDGLINPFFSPLSISSLIILSDVGEVR